MKLEKEDEHGPCGQLTRSKSLFILITTWQSYARSFLLHTSTALPYIMGLI